MCNQCHEDPRDELTYGAKALLGIRDLVTEVYQGKNEFTVVEPGGLAELLDMVHLRIERAAMQLQDYVPRDHPDAA